MTESFKSHYLKVVVMSSLLVIRAQDMIERIEFNERVFDVQMGVIDDKGEVTPERANRAVQEFLDKGQSRPNDISALTSDSKPVVIHLPNDSRNTSETQIKHWKNAPTLDAALSYITRETSSTTLIVPPFLKIPEDQDYQAPVDGNPYAELDQFRKQTYDGSLKFPELETFNGKRFGSLLGECYAVNYIHKGKIILGKQFSDFQPVIGSYRYIHLCLFEIAGVKHKEFKEDTEFHTLEK